MSDFLTWINQVGLRNIIWMTDIDETLVEKAADPGALNAPTGLEDDCRDLDTLTGGRFYIITGRELPYIDQLFPQKTLKASCEYHNIMRFDKDAAPQEINPKPDWSLIDNDLQSLTARFNGMVLRIKPFMRSLHYIGADTVRNDPAVKNDVQNELEQLLDRYEASTGQPLTIIDGGKVFDMGPGGLDKGNAVKEIINICNDNALIPIYFGDSPGDLPAATIVQRLGGKFIAVGDDDRVTQSADFHFKDPQEYRDVLQQILQDNGLTSAQTPTAAPKP